MRSVRTGRGAGSTTSRPSAICRSRTLTAWAMSCGVSERASKARMKSTAIPRLPWVFAHAYSSSVEMTA